jgi:hypothetical protein
MPESRGTRPPKQSAAGEVSGAAAGRGRGILRPISGWLGSQVRAAGRRLFCQDDIRARQHGWQVEHGRLGLSRTYRDSRFSSMAAAGGSAPGAGDRCMSPAAGPARRGGTRFPDANGRP